ncbi:hypothetical protein CR513_03782, partial [Mucuna pruriens]
MFFGHIELHTELRWGRPHTGLSSGNKGNSSCKNWTNSTWRPMRTLESISRKKRFHDQQVPRKEFQVGQKVLLFNSRLKIIVGKLHSRWDGPFVITNVFPYGTVELKDEHTNNTFQVNGHRIKLFHEGPAPITGDMETISLMEPAPPDDTL